MTTFFTNPMIQYGALGLAFVLILAFTRAFFLLMAEHKTIQESLLKHHNERERAFTEQFLACVDRNSAALEKVEQSLQRIHIQLARNESQGNETLLVQYD